MARIFDSVRANRPKRNLFDLSHDVKLSMNMGDLVPVLCQEVVPGDKFQVNTESLIRLAPMIAPMMHRVNVYMHYFFVPNRLVFDSWKDFITGGEKGTYQGPFPMISAASNQTALPYLKEGFLADYFGIPPLSDGVPVSFSALPFRAYQLIYNEFFRDQNLEDPVSFGLGGSVDPKDIPALLTMRQRCWEKDYFTSALPWAQRGNEVDLPLTGNATVYAQNNGEDTFFHVGGNISGTANITGQFDGGKHGVTTVNGQQAFYDPNGTMYADMSDVSGVTINELRRATRLQAWLERNARGGSRYIEQILSHFGVQSSDARLQRPEYLGGGKTPIVISEVLQTSESNDQSTPQGNMSGHGISVGNSNQFSRFFEEHGYIIGIMSVLPRSGYQQGIAKHFFKSDRFDYFWPEFAHLGEQPVLNKELYLDPDGESNNAVFGYQPRYCEYKYAPSRVHGEFRSSLSYWHLGRIFSAPPALNSQFVHVQPTETSRVFAVEDPGTDKLYVQLYHNIRANRPMPKFGTPTL